MFSPKGDQYMIWYHMISSIYSRILYLFVLVCRIFNRPNLKNAINVNICRGEVKWTMKHSSNIGWDFKLGPRCLYSNIIPIWPLHRRLLLELSCDTAQELLFKKIKQSCQSPLLIIEMSIYADIHYNTFLFFHLASCSWSTRYILWDRGMDGVIICYWRGAEKPTNSNIHRFRQWVIGLLSFSLSLSLSLSIYIYIYIKYMYIKSLLSDSDIPWLDLSGTKSNLVWDS